jgi:hypothetical protein
MMLFGMGQKGSQAVKRGGLFGGNLRGAALAGAGLLALRWWRNRRSSTQPPPAAGRSESTRNPIDGWQ